MTSLITLADFAGVVPFSVNISATTSTPHIHKAQEIDVLPLLPGTLQAELRTPRASWSAATETLFVEKIKVVLVHEAARRLLLWHGTHVTPDALEELSSDINRAGASSQRRAVLAASVQADLAYYRAQLLAALPKTVGQCGTSTRRPGRGGLQVSTV